MLVATQQVSVLIVNYFDGFDKNTGTLILNSTAKSKQTEFIFKPHDKKNNFYEPCKLEESIKAQQIKRFLVVT